MKSLIGWPYWDVSALVAGVAAIIATVVAMEFDLWGDALPFQALASIMAILAGVLAWRTGARFLIFFGLLLVAMSWLPLGLIIYSCAILKNCP